MSLVSFGPMYNFLGIKISFIDSLRVCIGIREYLLKAISLYSREEMKSVTTPERNKLRMINRNLLILNNNKRKNFHSIVMLLMHIA